MNQLFKISSGLILQENWENPTGWSGTGSHWNTGSNPGFVAFGRTPIPALVPSPAGGVDASGCREVCPFIEEGNWHLLYDAGDGTTSSTTGVLRPQWATSKNRGISYNRNGCVLGNSGLLSGGSEGVLSYRGLGNIAKVGSTYVLFSLYGYSTFSTPNGKAVLGNPPYICDTWTAPSISGPWTYTTNTPVPGPSGSYNSTGSQAESLVSDGTNLWCFFVASSDPYGTNINVGLAKSLISSPGGPWVAYGSQPILPQTGATTIFAENPKVWYWPKINCYVMTVNGKIGSGYSTSSNYYYLNSSLSSWSSPLEGPLAFQHVNGAVLNQVVSDGYNCLGVFSPLMQPNCLPVIDSNGYIPAVYDYGGDDLWSSSSANAHTGRNLGYTVLEPSPNCLSYGWTSGSDVANLYRKSVSHTNFVAELAVDYTSANNTGYVGIGLDYRVQASGDSYRVLLPAGSGSSPLSLYKSSGGSGGTPGTYNLLETAPSGSGTSANMKGSTNQISRFLVMVSGNTHSLYLDGELQIVYTDNSSPYTSGVAIGFVAGGMAARFRLFHMRSSNSITISGLSSGNTITLRAPGDIPVETATTSGTSYTTSTVTHYPLNTISYAGTDYSFANSGLIWGGDQFVLPAPNVGLTTTKELQGIGQSRS